MLVLLVYSYPKCVYMEKCICNQGQVGIIHKSMCVRHVY